MDWIYIVLLLTLFGVSFALIPAFDRLLEKRQNHRDELRK
jgi:hypothetical protein